MHRLDLNGVWEMRKKGESNWTLANVPGSVFNDLLVSERIQDFYYRENEEQAIELANCDYQYRREFNIESGLFEFGNIVLCCEGLDTICELSINGDVIGKANNMHRRYEFDIKDAVRVGSNLIEITFFSPVRYIEEKQAEDPLWGIKNCTEGFSHIRKAHYMFGWDWGPKIPDLGIWRDIYICAYDKARIRDVRFIQQHFDDGVVLGVDVKHDLLNNPCACCNPKYYNITVSIKSPDGGVQEGVLSTGSLQNHIEFNIVNPHTWWPNGLGNQPLYEVEVTLKDEQRTLDFRRYNIGLRTITVKREKDVWGESFELNINDVSIFAFGANYIPEDSLLARCSYDRTKKLIEACANANFNCIRVWGGGIYPPDYFYDLCDEHGLIVWQDFMFACAAYDMNGDFEKNVERELRDNVSRIRHHACLGLWCGNNEVELAFANWEPSNNLKYKAEYIKQFEMLFPKLMKELDPNTFYWPSSPSTRGSFDEPQNPNTGDVHYWDVWHRQKPFTEYRNHYFRFLSEFGFQSFPSIKTIEAFTQPSDRNIFSAVMESHQKNEAANGKILYYLSENFKYPKDFESLVYASQILQAEAIKYGVEHFRRNRGRCMGTLYWQINDSWPVASWSGIDYYGRWKALHYFARKFYSPILLSVCEEENGASLHITNDTMEAVDGRVEWSLRDNRSQIITGGEQQVYVKAMNATEVLSLDFAVYLSSKEQRRSRYLEYAFICDGDTISMGTVLFTKAKHFEFIDPDVNVTVEERVNDFLITLNSKAYSRYVQLDLKVGDCVFSDNFFDLHANIKKIVTVNKRDIVGEPCLEDFKNTLLVTSIYDMA
ncbi:MAG: glycoside hydrolase family 2 protein [Firmicutes bacterium]|nr:glycoside hydrolase family 2 protein [Bacillota bacterium]